GRLVTTVPPRRRSRPPRRPHWPDTTYTRVPGVRRTGRRTRSDLHAAARMPIISGPVAAVSANCWPIANCAITSTVMMLVPPRPAAGRHQGGHRVVEFEVLGDGLVVVTDVDAQHRATEGVESLLHKLQVIDFRPTRCTPLDPSVEDDDLAFKIRQADLLTLLHQRRAGEVRQRGTFLLCVDNLGLASW